MATAVASLHADLTLRSAAFLTNMQKAERAMSRGSRRMNRSISRLDRGINRLRLGAGRLAGALLAGLGVRALVRMTDGFTQLGDRVRTAAGEGADFDQTFENIFATAQRTRTGLQNNVALFQRLAIGAREFGATNDQILAVSQSVQQLGIIGGASTTALRAGTTQFAQAMTSGIVRAEEMNSLLENIPEVAQRIARGMGMTTGELRKQVIEGKVLSEDVFKSLLAQTDEISEDFAGVTVTLAQGWGNIARSLSTAVGRLNQATGFTEGLAGGMVRLGRDIDVVTGNLTGAAAELAKIENRIERIQIAIRRGETSVAAGIGNPERVGRIVARLNAELEQLQARAASLRKQGVGAIAGGGVGGAQKGIDDLNRFNLALERRIIATENLTLTLGRSEGAVARVAAEQRLANLAKDKDIRLTRDQREFSNRLFDDYERGIDRLARLREQQRRNEQAFDDMGRAASDFLGNLVTGADSARASVARLAQSLLNAFLTARLFDPLGAAFSGFLSGIGTGGAAPGGQGITAARVGAQHGADFIVGGRGGTDANLVPMALTSGERVTVRTEAQQRAGGGGPVNQFFVDMRGASVEAVRRLEDMVARLDASIEPRAVGASADAARRGVFGA